jgi:cytochrome c oxidase subunit 2
MTPRRSRARRLFLAVVGMSFLLAGCDLIPSNKQNPLDPKGSQADKIFRLFVPISLVATAIGIAVIAATVFISWRFRYRPGVNENPKQIHGNTKLEIGWTILPALILAVVAVPTVSTIFDLAKNPGPSALQVTVNGKQWWWQFTYPSEKVVTADELVIPTGRKVHLTLKACEGTGPSETCNVIHSFWVPQLAGKTDVVPGRENTMTLEADHPGTYLGQCAEYCGLSHANMRFRVIAKSPSDFDDWVSSQQQGPVTPLTDASGNPAGDAQQLIMKTFQCTNCHIFDDSSKASYGPNLTHLASRDVFASGVFPLTRENLVRWLLDAPSLIPMQSEYCRLPPSEIFPTGDKPCVGMPSFTRNTPPGKATMTEEQAGIIADYLLGQK